MHADTGADVTARALATIEQARDIHAAIPPENPFEAITLHGMQIAAAAVWVAEDPYWWLTSDEYEYRCNACDGKGLKPVSVTHAPDCRAMALDAAIRAAGEACT